MAIDLELEDFMNILFENACIVFSKTPQYELIKEKHEKIHEDCKAKLSPDDFNFVQDCFDLLLETEVSQM